MSTYFVANWGTDGNSFASYADPTTPAKTLKGLFTAAAAAATGFAAGDKIRLAGIIRGTQARPLDGQAVYNFSFNPTNGAVPVDIGPWLPEDGTPSGSNRLTPPIIDASVPFTNTLTNNGSGTITSAAFNVASLTPAGKVSYISAIIKETGVSTAKDGRRLAHLAAKTSAANAVASPYNGWFHDAGATNVITLSYTTAAGAVVTTSPSSGDFAFIAVGDGTTQDSASNGGITLQNANGCRIWGIQFINFNSKVGMYAASTEGSSNCVIEDCICLDGAGHHAFGHTIGTTTTTSNNVIRRCQVRGGAYGANGSDLTTLSRTFRAFSTYGVSVCSGNVIEDCVANSAPVLNPAGTDTYAAMTGGNGFGCFSMVATADSGCSNNVIRNCAFYGTNQPQVSNPSIIELGGGANPSSDNTHFPSTYPVRVENCTFSGFSNFNFTANGSAGITDSEYAISFSNCVIEQSSMSSRLTSGASWNPFMTLIGKATKSFKLNFSNSTFTMDLAHPTASTTVWGIQVGARSDISFTGCVLLDVSKSSRTNSGIFYPNSNTSNAIRVKNSIIGSLNQVTGTKLLTADTIPDAQLEFSGNTYVNIASGSYSTQNAAGAGITARDTAARWNNTSTGIDRTGVESDNPFFQIQRTLGTAGGMLVGKGGHTQISALPGSTVTGRVPSQASIRTR